MTAGDPRRLPLARLLRAARALRRTLAALSAQLLDGDYRDLARTSAAVEARLHATSPAMRALLQAAGAADTTALDALLRADSALFPAWRRFLDCLDECAALNRRTAGLLGQRQAVIRLALGGIGGDGPPAVYDRHGGSPTAYGGARLLGAG